MLVIVAAFLMFKSAEAAKKLHYFNTLRSDNEFLKKENGQLHLIYQKIGRIDSFALFIERLSAISPKADKTKSYKKVSEEKIRETVGDTTRAINSNRNMADIKGDKNAAKRETTDLCVASIPSILPVEGWITQQFIDDTSHGAAAHPGIDIAAAEGVSIKATAPGTVLDVETDQYYGNLIVIKHDNEFTTRYGHCAKDFIGKDDKTERGQIIALVGNTGHSTAPHLHYVVIRNGKNVNPLEYISSEKK